jgi:hypothetical protein
MKDLFFSGTVLGQYLASARVFTNCFGLLNRTVRKVDIRLHSFILKTIPYDQRDHSRFE